MKVVELIGIKKRIELMLRRSGKYNMPFEMDLIVERDKRLLEKLDAINNCLNMIDAQTYIKVMRVRISVATAVEYLKEMSPKKYQYGGGLLEDEFDCFTCCRMMFWNNCREAVERMLNAVDGKEPKEKNTNDTDHLLGKELEYEQKMVDFYVGLKTAISISNATTEVDWEWEGDDVSSL